MIITVIQKMMNQKT
ncbi:hypothetical protein KGM_214186 [Danaus plexippus plexippus]|uniref:Uncharacterized protein n=1 Tax=Danaus plexippus plexippus TaxID=278856 RepID=A0A212ES67_DANPL|nr:hypothetical protein KGM_214186 [Danaus plexippus plexippus]